MKLSHILHPPLLLCFIAIILFLDLSEGQPRESIYDRRHGGYRHPHHRIRRRRPPNRIYISPNQKFDRNWPTDQDMDGMKKSTMDDLLHWVGNDLFDNLPHLIESYLTNDIQFGTTTVQSYANENKPIEPSVPDVVDQNPNSNSDKISYDDPFESVQQIPDEFIDANLPQGENEEIEQEEGMNPDEYNRVPVENRVSEEIPQMPDYNQNNIYRSSFDEGIDQNDRYISPPEPPWPEEPKPNFDALKMEEPSKSKASTKDLKLIFIMSLAWPFLWIQNNFR